MSIFSFLFKASKLSPVMDRDKNLPDDEKSQAYEDDAKNDTEDDPPNVDRFRANYHIHLSEIMNY